MEPQGKLKIWEKLINSFLCASNDPEEPKKTYARKCIDCLKPTTEPPADSEAGPQRETWGSRITFFITCLGMSVGLGQVWRFPTLAYANGGGAFLLLYGTMIFLFGNALFFFEISNGQYASKNPLRVFDKVPVFIGLGWSMIIYAYLFCLYYSHMVSFAMYYFSRCFTSQLPWSSCPITNDFPDSYICVPYPMNRNPTLDGIICGYDKIIYNHTLLCANDTFAKEQQTKCCSSAKVEESKCNSTFNITELCRPREYPTAYFWNHVVNRKYREDDPMHGYVGPVNSWLLTCSFITWVLAFFSLYKGIKSLGVLMYIMVPLPYIVLLIMLGVAVPQEGSTYGLKKFFIPNPKSFYDITVWRTATEQAFYSIGVAMGPLITFGSYAKFESPSHIDGVLICLCIFLTSVLCSLVVFSVLGFLAVKTGKPFDKIVEAGPGLVFIIYPESLGLLPIPQFFSALFYLMLMNLGMSSVTGIIETTSSAFFDIWPETRRMKYLVNLGVLASAFLFGIPITTRGGLVVYNCYDTYSAGIPLIPICALELLAVIYIYGIGRFCEDINFMLGFYPNRYYRYQWMVGPFILMAICLYGLATLKQSHLKPWAIAFGWFLFTIVMMWIIIGVVYTVIIYKKKDELRNVFKAPPEHGPKKDALKEARKNFSVKRKIF